MQKVKFECLGDFANLRKGRRNIYEINFTPYYLW